MIMLHWWRLELPPRARRILRPNTGLTTGNGTTSACAENTPDGAGTPWIPRNYLRVRGEYFTAPQHPHAVRELPPRARRIRPQPITAGRSRGTTSACAENTYRKSRTCLDRGNYLRVRGEYPHLRIALLFRHELPPRARRIHFHHHFKNVTHGTTSACAENTVRSSSNPAPLRNYLRVRGEYLALAERLLSSNGTTSACAENT